MSKLVSDFDAILVRLSMEGFAEQEGKLTMDYLVATIQSPVVQKRAKELLRLAEYRIVRKDARIFKKWLADYMRWYGEFEPLMAAAASRKALGAPDSALQLAGRAPVLAGCEVGVCWAGAEQGRRSKSPT